MPVAMAFSVVATANHFVIDVVVGVALVLLALAVQHAASAPRAVVGALRGIPLRSAGFPHLHQR
jgi:hypothetical protein